jgi:hypothetical protein
VRRTIFFGAAAFLAGAAFFAGAVFLTAVFVAGAFVLNMVRGFGSVRLVVRSRCDPGVNRSNFYPHYA